MKKWTSLVDLGGLFLFIRHVDTLVRKTLTFSFMKTYESKDIRELLHEKLEESNMINKLWEGLTRHVPNKQIIDHLLREVLSK